MDTKNKNPLLSGLMNVVLPGSSQLYVNKDWVSFLGSFLVGIVAGKPRPGFTHIPLPNGLCTGVLLLIVVVFLFISGQKTASGRNNEKISSAFYNSKRVVSHESDEKQLAQIQGMRDDGLMWEEEFEKKSAKIRLKKSK